MEFWLLLLFVLQVSGAGGALSPLASSVSGPAPDDNVRAAGSASSSAPVLNVLSNAASVVSTSAEDLMWQFRSQHQVLATDMEAVLEEVRTSLCRFSVEQ